MTKQSGKKMGRPIVMTEEKIKQLKAICRMKPTLADCAAFLDISEDSIVNYCKSIGLTFSLFREQNMVHTRFMIIRNIIKQCENGSIPMLIYASKNLCGWSDKPLSEEIDFNELSVEELKAITKKAMDYIKERESMAA